MSNFKILSSFRCPITLEVMDNPVILIKTSQTYEKCAIERWLSVHDTCPLTGTSLHGNHQKISNLALKESIDEWQQFTAESLKSMKYEILFHEVKIDSLVTHGRSKDVFKGKFCWHHVAVCISNNSCPVISENEANILATIGKHPNIIRFIARSTNPEGKRVTLFELAPIGNLHSLISDYFDNDRYCLTERIVSTLLYQIANGMEEIHLNNIIHKDLAARNILVFSFDKIHPDRIRVKVAGFDMSSIMEQSHVGGSGENDADKLSELPIRWMAPETLSTKLWSDKSDVYSFGVLIWECLSGGEVPWGLGATYADIKENVMRGDMLPGSFGWLNGLKNLMQSCCSPDAASRPSFREIKEALAPLMSAEIILPPLNQDVVEERIRFSVKSQSGDSIECLVSPSVTIGVIMNRIAVRWYISSESFRLIFDGERLQKYHTLSQYEIKNGDLIDAQFDMVASVGIFGTHSHTPGIELLMTDSCRGIDWIKKYVGSKDRIRMIVEDIRKNHSNNNSNDKESEVYCSDNITFLDHSQCRQLRELVDSKADDSFDYKLPVRLEELQALLGEETVSSLSGLMSHDFDTILLRRSRPQSLCIAFHLDASRGTLQVALNDEQEYEGGRLVYALGDGSLLCPARRAGSATRHDSSVVHGVSKHTAGIRYGLFLLKTSQIETGSRTMH